MAPKRVPRSTQPSRPIGMRAACVGLATVGLIAACERTVPTNPLTPSHTASRSTGGGGNFTIGVLPTTTINYGSEGWQSTAVTVDSGYRYRVTVTGSVTASPNTELGCYSSINWNTVPDLGTYGPGQQYDPGHAGGLLGVTVAVDTTGSMPIGMTTTIDGSSWQSDIKTAGRTLMLWAKRNPGPVAGTNCASSPPGGGLYALSGSSTIAVSVLPPLPPDSLLLTASPAGLVKPGTSIRFTGTFTQSQSQVAWWEWHPDSIIGSPRAAATTICQAGNTCTYAPQYSGWVHAVIDGFKRESLHVDVIPCPFNDPLDPLLDNPEIRRQLMRQFRISDSTHLERAGAIYSYDGANPPEYYFQETTTWATECLNGKQNPILPGLTKVADWHMHPGQPGMVFSNCPTKKDGAKMGSGASPDDYDAMEKRSVKAPEIIMDRIEVTLVAVHQNITQRTASTRSRQWRSCKGWATIP